MNRDAAGTFLARLDEALEAATLVRLVLAGPRDGVVARQVLVRPVILKSGPCYSVVRREPRRDLTQNLPAAGVVALCREEVGRDFTSCHLHTPSASYQLECRDPARARLSKSAGVPAADLAALQHDRVRARKQDVRSPWLNRLGVTQPDGRVAKGMESKFRQIHRFLELLDPLLADAEPHFAPGPGRVLVDMGCGKGYLTFAAAEHLARRSDGPWQVRGIEQRPELVALCNDAARACGLPGLEFAEGSIAGTELTRVDVLVALHACDTATDDALACGVRLGASLILVSPCCHKELRPQLTAPPGLERALRHGIFRERQAEFITDALRAELLEWAGYDTRVFEFISPEHTGKNLMISAVRTRPQGSDQDAAAARALAGVYGIRHQRLATGLGLDLVTPKP
jgi:SAM-dependent methyltransferase